MDKCKQFEYFVGIDVSKLHLDVCVLMGDQLLVEQRIENTKKGWNQFLKMFGKNHQFEPKSTLFCLENTGMYSNPTLYTLFEKGLAVWLETPIQIKKSQGLTRGKSDKVDAHRIATYALTFFRNFKPWAPPRAELLKIKRLFALREKIKKNIGQYLAPAADLIIMDDPDVRRIQKKVSDSILKLLRKKLMEIEDDIKSVIASDEKLKRLFEIARSVDSIGFITALGMIVNTCEFEEINCAKKYACYCGIAPFEHSSGSSIKTKKRVSHFANKHAKSTLHLAAMSAINMKGELQDYYLRKVKEGKPKLLALNAVRNKLVQRVFSCVKRDELYQKVWA